LCIIIIIIIAGLNGSFVDCWAAVTKMLRAILFQNITTNTTPITSTDGNNTFITLTAFSGRRNLTFLRPSVCLSHRLAHRDSPGAACDAASVNFGLTIRKTDIFV